MIPPWVCAIYASIGFILGATWMYFAPWSSAFDKLRAK